MRKKIGLIPPEDLFLMEKNKSGVNLDQFKPTQNDLNKAKNIIESNMDEIMNASVDDILNTQNEDIVNQPSHYKGGRYEVIDFIEDYINDFRLANVIKYISRAGKKDPLKYEEDLKKAQWYLNRFIEKEFGNQ